MGLASSADVAAINRQLARHDKAITANTQGIAIAMAMGGAPALMAGEKLALTANWGTFDGEHAVASSFALRLTPNMALNGSVGYAPEGGKVGARVGVRIGW